MEEIRIDLKTFLGLAMPNQCCPTVPALALGGVGSLPRASRFRGPHSSKKRALQAVG